VPRRRGARATAAQAASDYAWLGLSPERKRFWSVLALAWAVYLAGTHPRVFAAGNDASRWAQIESLVDFRSASIERSRFRATVDRVIAGGREYSNKPPLLAFAGAALYAPLEAVTGWRLGDAAAAPALFWILTGLLVGLPGAVTVALFDRALARRPGVGPRTRTLLTVALGAGTLLLSFSGTLNNHVPAACLLLAAVLAALDGRAGASGLACGVAGAVDLLPGFGFAPFLTFVVALPGRGRTARLVRFAAGLAAGLAILVAGNFAITGTPLPPKLLPGAVDLSVRAGPSVAGVVLPQSPLYPLEVLFGGHGLFTVSPVLVLGALGLVLAARRGARAERRAWAAIGLGVTAQVVGHAFVAGSYGGWSYGFRYLIPIAPLMLLAAPAALERPGGRAGRVLLAFALPPSLLFAALGAYHPWPPAFEQATLVDPVAAAVRDPIGGNAAAFAVAHWPESALADALARGFVAGDQGARRRYFALFFASKGDLETARRFLP
jgi:hypothetical protein